MTDLRLQDERVGPRRASDLKQIVNLDKAIVQLEQIIRDYDRNLRPWSCDDSQRDDC